VVTISSAEVTDTDPTLQKMALSLSVSVGGCTQIRFRAADGARKSVDLDAQLKKLTDKITGAIKEKLSKAPPTLKFGTTDASVSISAIDLDLVRGNAIIDGDLHLSLGLQFRVLGLSSITATVQLLLPLGRFASPQAP